VAVVCTVALVVLLVVLVTQDAKGKLLYDWPFIVAYTVLFLCIAAMYWLHGRIAFALATAAFAIATAVFDTIENLGADPTTHLVIVSKQKWAFFFVCVLLTIPLFLSVKSWLARAIVVLFLVAGVAGVVATVRMEPGRHQATQAVFGASGVAILAFLLADVIFLRDPRALLG